MTSADRVVPGYKRPEDIVWAEIGLCSVGFVMFLITLVILCRRTLQSAYTPILIQIAILDVCYLLSLLISNIFYIFFDLKIFHIQTVLCMILFIPITLMFITTEVYMVGALVLKYIIVILKPVKYDLFFSERKASFMMVCVWILSFGYNYPHWHAYMPAVISSNHHNYTWPKVWKDDSDRFIKSYFYQKVFGLYMLCVFEFLVPISVFIAGLVIVRHSQHSDEGDVDNIVRSSSRTHLLETNKSLYKSVWYIIMSTLLTRIVTACFFTFQGPSYCPEVHSCMFSDNIMRQIYICNAMIKFLIYLTFWPNFRQEIQNYICCKHPQVEFV